MESIFIAHSFQRADEPLAQQVADVVRAFGLEPLTGRNLGGGVLTDEVKRRIDRSDALVALFTVRQSPGGWITHPWVMSEFDYAIAAGKPCIAVVDTRINWGGTAHANRERIDLNEAERHEAVFSLIQEVGGWKRDAGAPLQLLIRDDELIERTLRDRSRLRVEYRCGKDAHFGPLRTTDRVMVQAGALVIVLPSVPSREHDVELVVSYDGERWHASIARHYIPTALTKV